MESEVRMSWTEFLNSSKSLANHLSSQPHVTLVAIPRGGLMVATALAMHLGSSKVTLRSLPEWTPQRQQEDMARGECFLVDDVITSGNTMRAALAQVEPGVFSGALVLATVGTSGLYNLPPFQAVFGYQEGTWVHFPWEANETGPEQAVVRLIEYLGDDPRRPGLIETPRRVLGFYQELRQAAEETISSPEFFAASTDLVVIKDIPFFSLCEHHMLPYHGTAVVGYLPVQESGHNDESRVVGLSKVPRAIRTLAAGLTMQEELTSKIALVVSELVKGDDVGVVVRATHTCVTVRGPRATGTEMVTSSLLGSFRSDPSLRAEFMNLIRG